MYSQQPTRTRAPCLRGVNPCWWRPKPTVGKLSLAPCATLLPYSWPCLSVDGEWGKPWEHQLVSARSCLKRLGRTAVYSQQPTRTRAPCLRGVNPCWWRPKPTVGKLSLAPCATLLPYSWPCSSVDGAQGKPWEHQCICTQLPEANLQNERTDVDARLCILSSPPEQGHRVFVV